MTKRAYQLALTALLLSLNLGMNPAQAATATRSSSFVYDTASGLLLKEIIEPNDPQLCLVTQYTYDGFGNKTGATTRNCAAGEGAGAPAAGSDGVIQSRSTSSTYDARGQFAVSTTNALGHTETRTFDPKFGGVATLTGPNGLATAWTYDSFGRKTLETRADGTTTAWTYVLYNKSWTYTGHYWLGYYIATTDSASSQSVYTYYDNLNRKLMTTRRNMANTDWIDEENTIYDAWGRVSKVYLPYERANTATAKYATYTYDILGRVKQETAADGSITTKTYAGLTSTVTNSKGQTTTTLKNTQGQTVTVTNPQSRTIGYLYDPFGNLTKTTDALGNVTELTYDTRGRKTGMNDPDMGTWTYAYNALGELIRQIDAKGQTVTMVYDKLGRMTSRNEPDLVSTWTYDTATKGIGKLATATAANGYSRTHSYDALGRLSSTSTVIDDPANPYVTSTTYDSIGRVDTQVYPASPAHPNGFAVKNFYNGVNYLTKVLNAATNAVLWQADAMDAMGHLTQQTYGNGIVTQQVYNPLTGRLEQQLAGAGNAVQNMSYQYDTLGNLSTRTDVNQNLTETYTYDALNRIRTAQAISGAVNVTHTYAYDVIGNIVCKSDISACSGTAPNYTYNASGANSVRPHAVASITGTVNGIVNPTFQYDANGNMESGAGRSIVWTSFNMPSQITSGTKTVGFWYNPEHERTKELQADGSIVIALSPRYDTGLHFEKKLISDPATQQLTGAVEYEHYLYAGGQMFGKYVTITQTDGVTLASAKTTYYSKDHLGSIVAITDEAGNIATDGSGQLARYSYDVWGKRRYPNGEADPNGLLNNPDMYHGYTGHEMLDEVGLIHMNGRLYDPLTGRFMSADPHIQDPLNLQSYNRYAYCMGNPMICNDPSGYFSLGSFFRTVVAIAVAVYAPQFIASSAFAGSVATATGLSTVTVGAISAGAISGAISTGSIQGALTGGLTAGMFAGIHTAIPEWGLEKILAHGMAGGFSSVLQGGSFKSGFLAAGMTQAFAPGIDNIDRGTLGASFSRTMAAAVVGGASSVLGGGKFANGAVTGAFSRLFNDDLEKAVPVSKDAEQYASSSSNEALAQAKGVGVYDALKANSAATSAMSDTKNSGLPGLHNGQADAFRHCDWSCKMAQSIGVDQAKMVGDIHEVVSNNSNISQPRAEFVMDTKNNQVGRWMGHTGQNCPSACMSAVKDGRLSWLR